jgi:hypothetical protein
MRRFCSPQSAVSHVQIEILAHSHAPKHRYLILNGMRSDGEDAKSALRHATTPDHPVMAKLKL